MRAEGKQAARCWVHMTRDKLNGNGKLLLDSPEHNKFALLNILFCTPKGGVSYTFQSANRSKE